MGDWKQNRELTKTQRETLATVKGLLATHETVDSTMVAEAMGINISTAKDRLITLEIKQELTGELKNGKVFYRLYTGAKSDDRRRVNHYVKRKVEQNLHPITIDDVEIIKERMKYRKGKLPGTMVRYLYDDEIDRLTGKKVLIIKEVEALKPYPHGALFAGKRFKTFLSWADLALYYRHGEKKPVGATYGRDEQ